MPAEVETSHELSASGGLLDRLTLLLSFCKVYMTEFEPRIYVHKAGGQYNPEHRLMLSWVCHLCARTKKPKPLRCSLRTDMKPRSAGFSVSFSVNVLSTLPGFLAVHKEQGKEALTQVIWLSLK